MSDTDVPLVKALSYGLELEDVADCFTDRCCVTLAKKLNELLPVIAAGKRFLAILEIEEESDMGNAFHPNRISSCRIVDGMEMNQCLKTIKEYDDSELKSVASLLEQCGRAEVVGQTTEARPTQEEGGQSTDKSV